MQLDIRRIGSYGRVTKGDDELRYTPDDRVSAQGHVVVADVLVSAMTRAQSRSVILCVPRMGLDTAELGRISHGGSMGWFVDSRVVVSDSEGYTKWSTRPDRLPTLAVVARLEAAASHVCNETKA